MAIYSLLFQSQRFVENPLRSIFQRAGLSPPLQHLVRVASHNTEAIHIVRRNGEP